MEKQHLTAGALDTAGALVSFRKGCLTSSIGWVVADVGGRVDEPADVPLGADEEDSSPRRTTWTRHERRRLAVPMRMRPVRTAGASLSTIERTYRGSRSCIEDLGFHGTRWSVSPASRRHVLLSVERAMDGSEERER